MPLPWTGELAGRIDEHVITSEALRGNALGDDVERPLWVYVPPGYDEGDARLPSIYVIQGYTGSLTCGPTARRTASRSPRPPMRCSPRARRRRASWCGWTPGPPTEGRSSSTRPGTGRYHSYLCDDVVAFVDERYRTLDAPAHRGIQGKSSGGFGAMITPMLRPDLFGGLATHAGDALYECCYIPEFPKAVRALRAWDGDIGAWWDDFQSRPAFTRPEDHLLLMMLGVSACFSADDDATPVLPFDPRSGRLHDEAWARWLAWDPVRMVPRYAEALRGLKAVWIDAGTRDEWYLDLGAVAFRDALADVGVTDVRFELFDATHGGISWRYPLSLAYLAQRLAVTE